MWTTTLLLTRWAAATERAPQLRLDGLGDAARAWVREGAARPRDVALFRALREAGFAPSVAPAPPDPMLSLEPQWLREAAGTVPAARLSAIREALLATPDPSGELAGTREALDLAAADRVTPANGGPLAPLAAYLERARARGVWLRSGGRMVAGWGRLRRRYPSLVDGAPLPPAASESPVEGAFAAAARGDEPAAARHIEAVEAAIGGRWYDGLLLRADLAEARGDVDAARALLEQAAELVPDRPDAALARADLEAFEGDDAAALRALAPWKDTSAARNRRAIALYRQGQVTAAAALGHAPERAPLEAAPSSGDDGPPAAARVAEDADPHARAAALGELGHLDEQLRLLAQAYADGTADADELLTLGALVARGGDLAGPTGSAEIAAHRLAAISERLDPPQPLRHVPDMPRVSSGGSATEPTAIRRDRAPAAPVNVARLAEDILRETGGARPGAIGVRAAEGAALASSLLATTSPARAAELTQVRRAIIDRSFDTGGTGPALLALLLDNVAELVEQGRTRPFDARKAWALRLLRESSASDEGVLARAARLVQALGAAGHPDADVVADAALTLVPETPPEVEALPAEACAAAYRLLELRAGPEAAQSDERFAHAPPRRLATAREVAAAGLLDEAAIVAASLVRKPLTPPDRREVLALLVAALDSGARDEARAALQRETGAISELAREQPEIAALTLEALLSTFDPELLSAARRAALFAWRSPALPAKVAAACADLLGHSFAAALLDPAIPLDPTDAAALASTAGGAYYLARALHRAQRDLEGKTPARRISARSPLPMALVDAARDRLPPLALVPLLARSNYDPADAVALLTV